MLSRFRENKVQDGLFCSWRARGWSAGLPEESRCRSSSLGDGKSVLLFRSMIGYYKYI